jgi:hypothetical protein
VTGQDGEDRAGVLATRIGEALGWDRGREHRHSGYFGFIAPESRSWSSNALHVMTDEVWAYSPGEPGSQVLFVLRFGADGFTVVVRPSDRHEWTAEAREFARRLNDITDGMLTYGLVNAGDDDALRWLAGDDAPRGE